MYIIDAVPQSRTETDKPSSPYSVDKEPHTICLPLLQRRHRLAGRLAIVSHGVALVGVSGAFGLRLRSVRHNLCVAAAALQCYAQAKETTAL